MPPQRANNEEREMSKIVNELSNTSTKSKITTPWGLLSQHANAIVEKLVETAMAGDLTALRICMERIIPRGKVENGIEFEMPNGSIDSGDNMLQITNNITKAVASGEMTIDEANKFTAFLRHQRRMIDDAETKIQDEERKKQRGW
jgi:hypothetical protein